MQHSDQTPEQNNLQAQMLQVWCEGCHCQEFVDLYIIIISIHFIYIYIYDIYYFLHHLLFNNIFTII